MLLPKFDQVIDAVTTLDGELQNRLWQGQDVSVNIPLST